jgi:Protein of unknown function (DUF5818)
MKRENSLLATLCFVFATLPLMVAQDHLQTQPSPALPPEALGRQLVAWSALQIPKPVQQTVRAGDQPAQQPNQQATNPQQPLAAQTFKGTIVKDGARYVLRVSSDSAYQLDDQEKAKQYEGKHVSVIGTLDEGGKTLHITSIELIS